MNWEFLALITKNILPGWLGLIPTKLYWTYCLNDFYSTETLNLLKFLWLLVLGHPWEQNVTKCFNILFTHRHIKLIISLNFYIEQMRLVKSGIDHLWLQDGKTRKKCQLFYWKLKFFAFPFHFLSICAWLWSLKLSIYRVWQTLLKYSGTPLIRPP